MLKQLTVIFLVTVMAWANPYGPLLTASVSSSTYNPATDTSVVEWLKADALTLNNNDSVTNWTASIGQTAITNGSAVKPLYKTNQKNGLPAVDFNVGGSPNCSLVTASFGTLSQIYYAWVVCKVPLTANRYFVFDGRTSANRAAFYKITTDKWALFAGGGADGDVATSSDTNWHIVECVFNSTSSTITIDNGSPATVLHDPGNGQFVGIMLGTKFDNTAPGFPLIGEIIIQNSTRTATSADIRNYLNGRWAVY